MSYTKRTKFLSIEGSYHGYSIGAMSIGSSDFRNWYKNLLPACYKIAPPLDEKAAREAEKILRRGDIAALIMEPIVCNLAVEIPTKEFFTIVVKACKKYGTLLVIDEVATGFGRTGKLFAAEYYNLEPDMMILAKAITGGYGGLGATIMTPQVAKAMDFPFSFYSTFGWNPINVAGALGNIRYILKRKAALLSHVVKMGAYFEQQLKQTTFPYKASIRIKGLAIAIEFAKDGYAAQLVRRCGTKGLLFTHEGRSITFFPALTVEKYVADEALEILSQCA